jgi:hypothetical protein
MGRFLTYVTIFYTSQNFIIIFIKCGWISCKTFKIYVQIKCYVIIVWCPKWPAQNMSVYFMADFHKTNAQVYKSYMHYSYYIHTSRYKITWDTQFGPWPNNLVHTCTNIMQYYILYHAAQLKMNVSHDWYVHVHVYRLIEGSFWWMKWSCNCFSNAWFMQCSILRRISVKMSLHRCNDEIKLKFNMH